MFRVTQCFPQIALIFAEEFFKYYLRLSTKSAGEMFFCERDFSFILYLFTNEKLFYTPPHCAACISPPWRGGGGFSAKPKD